MKFKLSEWLKNNPCGTAQLRYDQRAECVFMEISHLAGEDWISTSGWIDDLDDVTEFLYTVDLANEDVKEENEV